MFVPIFTFKHFEYFLKYKLFSTYLGAIIGSGEKRDQLVGSEPVKLDKFKNTLLGIQSERVIF